MYMRIISDHGVYLRFRFVPFNGLTNIVMPFQISN